MEADKYVTQRYSWKTELDKIITFRAKLDDPNWQTIIFNFYLSGQSTVILVTLLQAVGYLFSPPPKKQKKIRSWQFSVRDTRLIPSKSNEALSLNCDTVCCWIYAKSLVFYDIKPLMGQQID